MRAFFLAFFLLISLNISFGCTTDADCWYNGVCYQTKCVCDKGWAGSTCSKLNLLPAPVVGAYGYTPNVTSWGGVPILVGDTYHLYVAEMVNGCGLCTWGSNSRIVHATSKILAGPYKFNDEAIPVWSHNPQIVVDNSGSEPVYLIFHIGDGKTHSSPSNCNSNITTVSRQSASSVLHVSTSVDGPWIPQNPDGLKSCNNPAPFVFPNGSIYVVCTWFAYYANSWKGPWQKVPFQFKGNPGNGTWEDPFVWLDKRGVWKLLSHVWISTGVHYADRVAGFAYSTDRINWIQSDIPPFDNVVSHVDGSLSKYTTRERPKLFFDENGDPIALFNGVAGVPGGDKDTCGIDWTFTLMQPVGA